MIKTKVEFYIVLYRTGSKRHYKWIKVDDIFNYFGVKKKQSELKRYGYKVIGVNAPDFEKIGLPQSFAAYEYYGWGVIL